MVKPQSGFSSTPPIKEETYFVRFVLTILWIYYSKGDTKLPLMSLFTITSKNVERNGLNFSLGLIKHKP